MQTKIKQTAIEYLLEGIINLTGVNIANDEPIVEQAKEMERQQIVMAFWNSKHSLCDENTDLLYLAEQYYKVKFNK